MTEQKKNNSDRKVIVVGNEKGGSGKSTTAMHLVVDLLSRGLKIATIDVDARQGTFSRYIANRNKFNKASGKELLMPDHFTVDVNSEQDGGAALERELEKLALLIDGAKVNNDVVVIDTPGSSSALSRLAHSYCDVLVTPINDSLVDLDVIAHVDGAGMRVIGPSVYSEMVWQQKQIRAQRDQGTIDWVVLRNRISSLDSHNARDMAKVLDDLSKRMGLRVVPGFSERVIFRELFLVGLTILDLKDATGAQKLSGSHLAARLEVRALSDQLGLALPQTTA